MGNKLTSQANSVEINNVEYPMNTLFVEVSGEIVIVKTVSEGKTIGSGAFADWRDSADVPYASQGALITALRAALFV